jgi:hypothetical protein
MYMPNFAHLGPHGSNCNDFACFCLLQSSGGFFRGWVLGYSASGEQRTLYWSVATEKNLGRKTALYECGPLCEPGKWVHLIATYDGRSLSLYVNGEEAAVVSACAAPPCGAIAYPSATDAATPLTIGGYHNVRMGSVSPHVGSLRMFRISREAISSEDAIIAAKRHADLANSPVQQDVYWAHSTDSPDVVSGPVPGKTVIRVKGRFDPKRSYTAIFESQGKSATSAPNEPSSGNRCPSATLTIRRSVCTHRIGAS